MSNEIAPVITSGELAGQPVALQIVTDEQGRASVVFPNGQVAVGPTSYMPDIANWINDYLQG